MNPKWHAAPAETFNIDIGRPGHLLEEAGAPLENGRRTGETYSRRDIMMIMPMIFTTKRKDWEWMPFLSVLIRDNASGPGLCGDIEECR
jgi:hypothetical protein